MNILILTAMKIELSSLIKEKSSLTQRLEEGYRIQGGNNLFIFESGVGPISAGIKCEKLITQYNIGFVILLGLSGSLDERLKAGDHVLVDKIFQHDAICEYENKVEYMAPGELHLSLKPEERAELFLETSRVQSNQILDYLKGKGISVFRGDLASGSSFIGKKESKYNIKKEFPTSLIVEMEAIGVAMSCKINNKPFVVLKTVADSLVDKNVEDYIDFIKSEKEKCVDIISYFL